MPLRIRTTFLGAFLICASQIAPAADSTPIPLWPEDHPEVASIPLAERPVLRVFRSEEATPAGLTVLICPGGGYSGLAIDHEGLQPAHWWNALGVDAVVLSYRRGQKHPHPAPLHDAQRALRRIRASTDDWGLRTQQVGVMGFSAGGHLASTLSTHFDQGDAASVDPVDRVSCRPDFAVLCYPVITFTKPHMHAGSRRNLLGESPAPELIENLSNERQVTAETPPTFLFHTTADSVVPVENSIDYFEALVRRQVPAELHVFQNGAHGIGLAPGDPVTGEWTNRLRDWLTVQGIIPPQGATSP